MIKSLFTLILLWPISSYCQSKKELVLNLNQYSNVIDSLKKEISILNSKYEILNNDNQNSTQELLKSKKIIITLENQLLDIKNRNQQILDSFQKEKNLVSDYEGNRYNIFKSGSFLWLKQPLISTIFNDGTPIKKSENISQFRQLTSDSIPTFCYVDFDENKKHLGLIYNKYCWSDGRLLGPLGYTAPKDFDINAIFNGNKFFDSINIIKDVLVTFNPKDSTRYFLKYNELNKLVLDDAYKTSRFSDNSFISLDLLQKLIHKTSDRDFFKYIIPILNSGSTSSMHKSDYLCFYSYSFPEIGSSKRQFIWGLPIYCCRKI